MKKKLFFLFLFIISFWQSSNASPVVLNGVEYPEDLYNEIKGYIRETCLENALSSVDINNKNVYEILVNIFRKVKFDKTLYCPVCKINYPVSAEYSNNMKEIVASNGNSQVCIDGLPLNVSYQLPAECPLCGDIFFFRLVLLFNMLRQVFQSLIKVMDFLWLVVAISSSGF